MSGNRKFRSAISYWVYRLGSAWRYYRSAKTRYDLHSPALVSFQQSVLKDMADPVLEAFILDFRRWYAKRNEWIDTPTLGAGSHVKDRSKRRLSELVANSSIAPGEGRLLARLARYTEAKTIVELGTNGGVSTAYMAYAQSKARVITVEGNAHLAQSTRESLKHHQLLDRVSLRVGTFRELLPDLLGELDQIDLLFIDGDHRYGPTLEYVRMCLPKARRNTVFVIADIRWSAGMERAWKELTSWPEVSTTVATYHFGFLFFNEDMRGLEPINMIRARWKPWRMGFWG
ncbi:MAG: class I SAM-dependent methyltransferase [Bacteroidota bacterium]